MNDEIKEILNNLRYTAKKHTIQVLENGGKIEHCPQEVATEMRINTYSAKLLLDYITNLQQENEIVHKDLEELSQRYFFTKSRIEKAVEYLKNNCYIGNCINTYEAIDIINVMDILNGKGSDE